MSQPNTFVVEFALVILPLQVEVKEGRHLPSALQGQRMRSACSTACVRTV